MSALSVVWIVDVTLLHVDIYHRVEEHEERYEPGDEEPPAQEVAAECFATGGAPFIFLFGEALRCFAPVPISCIKSFGDSKTCQYSCYEASKMTPVVHFLVSFGANI